MEEWSLWVLDNGLPTLADGVDVARQGQPDVVGIRGNAVCG
jgi:hypothetical protein